MTGSVSSWERKSYWSAPEADSRLIRCPDCGNQKNRRNYCPAQKGKGNRLIPLLYFVSAMLLWFIHFLLLPFLIRFNPCCHLIPTAAFFFPILPSYCFFFNQSWKLIADYKPAKGTAHQIPSCGSSFCWSLFCCLLFFCRIFFSWFLCSDFLSVIFPAPQFCPAALTFLSFPPCRQRTDKYLPPKPPW